MSTLRVTGLKQETSTATNISLAVGGGVTVAGVSTFHNAVTASSGIIIDTQDTSASPLSIGSKGGGTNDGHLEGEGPKINFLATRSADGANGSAAYIQQKAIGDLGSSYPVDLAFGVRRFGSPFEAMRIASTGYVGIGTDIPAGQFQVGQSGGSNVIITANTGVDINDGAINLYQATSNANAVPFLISTDVGGTETEKLRVTAGGYVGIGTDNPSSELHVQNSSGNCGLRVISSATGVSYLNLGDTGDNNVGSIEYSNNENYLLIKTADNERLRINSSGYVGIGTDNPVVPIHLQSTFTGGDVSIERIGDNANGPEVFIRHISNSPADNDAIGQIAFGGRDSALNLTTVARIDAQMTKVANGSESGELAFNTRAAGTFSEKMRITSYGKVIMGIDTDPFWNTTYTNTSGAARFPLEIVGGNNANELGNVFTNTGYCHRGGCLSGGADNDGNTAVNFIIVVTRNSGYVPVIAHIDSVSTNSTNNTTYGAWWLHRLTIDTDVTPCTIQSGTVVDSAGSGITLNTSNLGESTDADGNVYLRLKYLTSASGTDRTVTSVHLTSYQNVPNSYRTSS